MTISRSELRSKYLPGQKNIYVKLYTTFGWKVHQHILPVGCTLTMLSTNTVEREKYSNKALYVRGRASVINDKSGPYPDRVPGLFTGDRPDHPEGITNITAIEELEFWCFNYHLNRGALPDLTPVLLKQNDILPLNKNIFMCSGSIDNYIAGDSFVSNEENTVKENSYCLIVGEKRV